MVRRDLRRMYETSGGGARWRRVERFLWNLVREPTIRQLATAGLLVRLADDIYMTTVLTLVHTTLRYFV